MKTIIFLSLILITQSFNVLAITKSQEKIMEYENLARKGDPEYQFKLGLIYEFGVETKINKNDAIYWYEKADKQNFTRASTRLGIIYYKNEDYKKSIEYIEKGLEVNEPLSIVYYGINKIREGNIEEAQKYFKKAMKLNNAEAFYQYGLLEGDYNKNYYLAYVNTKLAQIKGYKEDKGKVNEFKSKLSSNQIYSANDRIKRLK